MGTHDNDQRIVRLAFKEGLIPKDQYDEVIEALAEGRVTGDVVEYMKQRGIIGPHEAIRLLEQALLERRTTSPHPTLDGDDYREGPRRTTSVVDDATRLERRTTPARVLAKERLRQARVDDTEMDDGVLELLDGDDGDGDIETALKIDKLKTPISLLALPDDAKMSETAVQPEGFKYTIGQEVGRGGMGVVKIAKDNILKRKVALKMLVPERDKNRKLVRALISEAQVTGQLEHPNIIPVYELGTLPPMGRVYYTMKLMTHYTLKEVLDGLRRGDEAIAKEYSLIRLLQVVQSVCMGLYYAHSRGVVHRDLKPGNILLGKYGEVQVMDWGVAAVVRHAPGSEELDTDPNPFDDGGRARLLIGTLPYISREQLQGMAVDQRSDVYSLGVVLYEVLTLTLPYDQYDTAELALINFERPVTSPSVRAPSRGIHPALDAICLGALEPDVELRYQTAKVLWDEIELFLEGAKEKERIAKLALKELERGQEYVSSYHQVRTSIDELAKAVEAEERALRVWDPEELRIAIQDQANILESYNFKLAKFFTEGSAHLRACLGYEPGNDAAREALITLYKGQFAKAERARSVDEMIYFGTLIQELEHRGRPMDTSKSGRISVRTYPEGAEVSLCRYIDIQLASEIDSSTILGMAPIMDHQLPVGGYLLVIRKKGYRDVFHPVFIKEDTAQSILIPLEQWTSSLSVLCREAELSRVKSLMESAFNQERLRICLVSGRPGMGKQRLLGSFERYLDTGISYTVIFMAVTCRQLHQDLPFSAVADLVRFRAGIRPNDEPAAIRKKLVDAVTVVATQEGAKELDDEASHEVQVIAELLGAMPSLDIPATSLTTDMREDFATLRSRILWALERYFTAMAQWLPVVVVFHNYPWIDRSSRQFFDSFRQKRLDAPLFILGIEETDGTPEASPEDRLEPDLELPLAPLDPVEVERILAVLLKGPVSERLLTTMAHRTGGAPYLIESATKRSSLCEEIVFDEVRRVWDWSEVPSEAPLGMAEIVQGELESLGEAERQILLFGAVVGRVFWADVLEHLGIDDVASALKPLIERQLIIEKPFSRFHGTSEFSFAMNATWALCLDMVPDEERRALHRSTAEWLWKQFSGFQEETALLAYHFERAGDTEQAAMFYQRLGDNAMRFAACREALTHYRRALALPIDPPQRESLLGIIEEVSREACLEAVDDQ